MSYNNPYMAPSELATGGYINYEPSAITVTFMDVHYSLSTGHFQDKKVMVKLQQLEHIYLIL